MLQGVNKHGLQLRWPRRWIILIGIVLIFLCLCIAGMEIGHTISDVYRSTAFGGFILFLPLIICVIVILITASKPRAFLLRLAVILCFIMIILCVVLIAYDILVLIDPTQCFFLNCNNAVVNASNSTTNITVTGWPLNITWPSYFQANMNAKRIFQSIQLLCASLFILFAALYILTYFIYRRMKLEHQTAYQLVSSQASKSSDHQVTTYTIVGQREHPSSPASVQPIILDKSQEDTSMRMRASSVNYLRICTRCLKEPRMVLLTVPERQHYFSHLCLNCNKQILNYRHKGPFVRSAVSSS